MKKLVPIFCLAALPALAVACGDAKEFATVSPLAPVALDDHIVWVDSANHQAHLLDVGVSRPRAETTRHDLPEGSTSVVRRNGKNEVLVMSAGDSENPGKLAVLTPKGVDRIYDLTTSYDRLVQSDDGNYALAMFNADGTRTSGAGSLLFNPSEVAIINLNELGDQAVVTRPLSGVARAPQRVVFAPPISVGGNEKRLALALYTSQLAIQDLDHLDRPAYTVEFSQSGNLNLTQVLFSPGEQKIYLLGTSSEDIFVISLLPAAPNRTNDFEPTVNQLGTGETATDMLLYGLGNGQRLLAVSPQAALIIEASSNRVTRVPLEFIAERIVYFEGSSPSDDKVEARALLYGDSGVVTFIDLDGIEERKTRNLETLNVGSSVNSATSLSSSLVLLRHGDNSLSLLNLEKRAATKVSAQVDLSSAIPDFETRHIWVAPLGSPSLGFLGMETFQTGQVNLDAGVQSLMLMTSGKRKLAVVGHDNPGGMITLLNAETPSDKSQMLTLEGFFYAGALSR